MLHDHDANMNAKCWQCHHKTIFNRLQLTNVGHIKSSRVPQFPTPDLVTFVGCLFGNKRLSIWQLLKTCTCNFAVPADQSYSAMEANDKLSPPVPTFMSGTKQPVMVRI